MAITLKDVAAKVGISSSSVSHIINDTWREKRISPDTVARVKTALKEMNYHPHTLAKGLVENKTGNVAIAVRSITYIGDLYFAAIVGGAAERLGLHGYRIQLVTTQLADHPSSTNLHYRKAVDEQAVDGMILIDQAMSDNEITWLESHRMPFVLVDRGPHDGTVHNVRVDNTAGIRSTVRHLVSLGHNRIALILATLRYPKDREMLEGYKQGLAESGIDFDKDLLIDLDADDSRVSETARLISGRAQMPSALVCFSDRFAVKLIGELARCGIKVPEQVAVCGYNDDPDFAHSVPALTTVRVPLRTMGEHAGEMLLGLMEDTPGTEQEIILKADLVVRESCGAHPGSNSRPGGMSQSVRAH